MISIQLDSRPWPHVAHAAAESGEEEEITTVIVYGLDPGRGYEISVDVGAASAADSDEEREEEEDEEDEHEESVREDDLVGAEEESAPTRESAPLLYCDIESDWT